MPKVSFETEDGVTIVADWYDSGKKKAVLLLHMMPAAKESWINFARALTKAGISALAIDLRGHGESVSAKSGKLDFKKFSDAEHKASIKDAEASIKWLRERGAKEIYVAGASIGANLALQCLALHPEIKKGILLSAGFNYRGVETKPPAKQVASDQKVFLAAGTQDSDCADVADKLSELIAGQSAVKIYESAAHGTDLFDFDAELIGKLVEWLKE
jgi:alpha-beta hydrolase superfamily lysophospholipase